MALHQRLRTVQWRAVSRYKVEEELAKCVAARTIGFSDVMIIAGLRFRSK